MKDKKATEIGWNSSDDSSLHHHRSKRRKKKRKRSKPRSSRSRSRKKTSSSRSSRSRSRSWSTSSSRSWRSRSRSWSRDQRSRSRSCSPRPRVLQYNEDASPEKMLLRRKSLNEANFKFFNPETAVLVEDSVDFLMSKEKLRNHHRLRFHRRKSSDPNRYCNLEGVDRLSGCRPGQRFTVIWTGRDQADIRVDKGVKLYSMEEVIKHEVNKLTESPLSPWFGLIDPRKIPTFDAKVNFDANLFWSSAFYFKHFRTCGIEKWDAEIARINNPVPVHNNNNNNNNNYDCRKAVVAPCIYSGVRYTGCVVEWKNNYGFLKCTKLAQNVFIHSTELDCGGIPLPPGTSVNFELAETADGKIRAVKAKAYI